MMLRRTTRYTFAIGLILLMAMLVACVEENGNGNTDDAIDPGGAPTETPEDPANDSGDPEETPTATPDDPADDADGNSWELLATEKTNPPGTIESAIYMAQSQEAYVELWDQFQFEADAPAVDLERNVVIFAGTGESGTCPLDLIDVEYDPDERLLTLDVSEDLAEDTPCTDDWTPRAFVVAVDAEEIEGDELFVSLHNSHRGPGEIHREQVMGQQHQDEDWFELLVTEKAYPATEVGETLLELAEDETRYRELWDWFEFEEHDRPEVDWDEQAVLFAGMGESSGCPFSFDHLEMDEQESLLTVGVSMDVPEDTICTMDWTPRVFVIAVERETLGDGELRALIYDTRDDRALGPDDGAVIR